MSAAQERQPVFYYDLSSPACYLTAERILATLPVVPEWEPVLSSAIDAEGMAPDRERFSRQVARLGLQPLRWPSGWPPDGRLAALAATFAKRGGRAVAFSLAAFRQAFAGGRDLGEESTVLLAAAACEMHPAAVLKGVGLRGTAQALERANQRALAAGVGELPAIAVDGELFQGDAGLERAAVALEGAP